MASAAGAGAGGESSDRRSNQIGMASAAGAGAGGESLDPDAFSSSAMEMEQKGLCRQGMAPAAGASAGGESSHTDAFSSSATKTAEMEQKGLELGLGDVAVGFVAKGIAGAIVGAGAGALTGLLFGAAHGFPTNARDLSIRQKIACAAKEGRVLSRSDAKFFAKAGAIFCASEYLVKKARGGSDNITTKAIAGCVTGGILGAKGGPKIACIGSVGVSAVVVGSEVARGIIFPHRT